MAKLKYIDHSHENPVQAFHVFLNSRFDKPGFAGSGGVSVDPNHCHSICGQVYARFQQGADIYGLPLIHLLLSFSEEEASNISEEEILNLTDSLAQYCVPQLLFHATYKTDAGAEIHMLLNPMDYTMTLCCDIDLLYITYRRCVQYHFDHPELWEGHTKLKIEKDSNFVRYLDCVDKDYLQSPED